MLEEEFSTIVLPTLCTMLFFIFTLYFFRYLIGEPRIHIRDVTKQHNWKSTRKETKACYCSICEGLLLNVDGLMCDCCGVYVDPSCVKIADKQLKCKVISLSTNEPMKHHWVKGNLPLSAMCEVCNEECDLEPGLIDWWCCWCQRCVHEDCKPQLSELCDLGKFKSMIIPPRSLEVVNQRSTVRRRLQLRTVIPPNWPDWKPLIVVANKKSGNKDGGEILSLFRRLLNPAQVVDLSERDPVVALEWCRLIGKVKCTVLVAGGDGTIAWLLNTIHKLKLEPVPSVAIIPLGTGNDLSRVLGWGKEHDPYRDPTNILQEMETAEEVMLDRWTVTVKPYGGLGLRGSHQSLHMYNYIGIGVDAQVTLQFHRTRESRFYFYSSRLFNKLLYLLFGTQQVVERECKDLDQNIELYLDGCKADLPSIEGIVITNIPSWGAGVNLWNTSKEFSNQSFNDEKLEVVALYSSFHMAQLQVGLARPHRIGQAKSIKAFGCKPCPKGIDFPTFCQHSPAHFSISVSSDPLIKLAAMLAKRWEISSFRTRLTPESLNRHNCIKMKLLKSYAMQIDGEPWYQHPCEVTITYCNKASMLVNTVTQTT